MAFPNTGILDDFNRADGGLGANWTSPIWQGFGVFSIVSNRLAWTAGAFVSNYWAASFDSNQEVYCTTVTRTGTAFHLAARINSPNNDANVDMYSFAIDAVDVYLLQWVNGSSTVLDTTPTPVVTGDSVGLRCSGSDIEAWHKPAAGSWTLIMNATDTAIPGPGYIGLWTNNMTAFSIDDFGGGLPGASIAWITA